MGREGGERERASERERERERWGSKTRGREVLSEIIIGC